MSRRSYGSTFALPNFVGRPTPAASLTTRMEAIDDPARERAWRRAVYGPRWRWRLADLAWQLDLRHQARVLRHATPARRAVRPACRACGDRLWIVVERAGLVLIDACPNCLDRGDGDDKGWRATADLATVALERARLGALRGRRRPAATWDWRMRLEPGKPGIFAAYLPRVELPSIAGFDASPAPFSCEYVGQGFTSAVAVARPGHAVDRAEELLSAWVVAGGKRIVHHGVVRLATGVSAECDHDDHLSEAAALRCADRMAVTQAGPHLT